MNESLALVHTVPPLIGVFDRLATHVLPGVRLYHILDETILERIRQRGGLASADSVRLASHLAMAAEIGAAAALVTYSTISPCVDELAASAPRPVFRIDEAMIAEAMRLVRRIGVIATNPTTVEHHHRPELLPPVAGRDG